MSTLLSCRPLAIAVVMVFWGTLGLAQDLNAKWLAGTWRGTTPSPAGAGQVDKREIVFREDGTYIGEIQSVRGGLLKIAGSYKVAGDTLNVDGAYKEGPAGIQGTTFTYTLKRVGEDLEGTGYSHGSVRTFPVSLKKAK